ncbi:MULTISPECIES: hypothetical protein [Pantoea]|jgi:predicted PurR-regulated permease PerM|uniref:Uncharacterized protein n=2 Tax=root TaxID=1 RepID=A0A7Y6TTR0_9GAMM|nr:MULTISPECIES: hypothetical protein [Pantoea]MBZ6395581.1 hypothetical protein [Pantoea sp.]MBZ6439205.1 hypothetical protein [Pantoea sp.]MDU7866184.1 hypothetical protein [Pantoea sp.]NUY43600.1 hypothetical protein [Pantoea brenneri]NUY51126.1 hypothetical protein [Pantoea brenneri]
MDAQNKSDKNEYQEILKILDKRSRVTRLTLIILVYILILAVGLVFLGIFYTKNNDNSPFGKLISSLMQSKSSHSESSERLIKILRTFDEQNQAFLKDINESNKGESKDNITPQGKRVSGGGIMPGDSIFMRGDNSQNIANSIASVLLSLSLMIFVGFVMKAILVFIRYYMQLGTDFENQKIAYLLSKGEVGPFNDILMNLRKSNINFERTPSLPQEKIILSLVDALKASKSSHEK